MHFRLAASQALVRQSLSAAQPWPMPQTPQVPPPQSMSVSLPSFCSSLHWLVTHTWVLASHALLEQSASMTQPLSIPHGEQVPPPQSTPVSLPSLRWSAHWLATQMRSTPSHALLVQSPSTAHFCPVVQVAPQLPPQSTAVSSASLTPSEQ